MHAGRLKAGAKLLHCKPESVEAVAASFHFMYVQPERSRCVQQFLQSRRLQLALT